MLSLEPKAQEEPGQNCYCILSSVLFFFLVLPAHFLFIVKPADLAVFCIVFFNAMGFLLFKILKIKIKLLL